jgi:putative transposase
VSASPIQRRRTIRLLGYDYSRAGAYFVTVCTHGRACLFGEITDNEMRLNDAGLVVADEWLKSAAIRNEILVDEWVVMPNHFHGIVIITDGRGDRPVAPISAADHFQGDQPVAPTIDVSARTDGGNRAGPPSGSIGALMAGFKSAVTKRINILRGMPGVPIWQRNYHEHIIRDENSLARIRRYIADNPRQWALDRENPEMENR